MKKKTEQPTAVLSYASSRDVQWKAVRHLNMISALKRKADRWEEAAARFPKNHACHQEYLRISREYKKKACQAASLHRHGLSK